MLIYNQKKEFVGISEDTLRSIGYNSATELQEDAIDFADLFENKPGFLHNFKNFSWLEYILHSEQDNTKARIRCNGKIYESGFKIENYAFIVSGENEPGFSVELTDLIVIGDDDGSREREVFEPEAPQALQMPDLMQTQEQTQQTQMPLEEEIISDPVIPQAPTEPMSMPELDDIELAEETNASTTDFDFDVMADPEPVAEPTEFQVPEIEETPVDDVAIQTFEVPETDLSDLELETSMDYTYDPSIAADELGLPSDLIDEFVGDFIVQAKKFRPDIEDAIHAQDFDNIQILSHKLKGVAANLRIEDALEVLSFLNTSKDVSKLKKYLDYLYQIVHQLEFGDDDSAPINTQAPAEDIQVDEPAGLEGEDLYSFDLISQPSQEVEGIPSLDMDLTEDEEIKSLEDDNFQMSNDITELPIIEDKPSDTISTAEETVTPLDHIDTNKFDIHEASSNLDIPMETLKSYVDDFVDQANDVKSELESALTSKDFEEVKQLATQLKGMSEALNMTHATELLSTLQTTEDIDVAIENAKELFIFIREL